MTMDTLNAENLPLFIQQNKAQLPSLIGPDGDPNFLELFYYNLEQFVTNNRNSIPALFSDIFFEIHPVLQIFLLQYLSIGNLELLIIFLENLDVSTMDEAEPDILNSLNVFIIKIFDANITFDQFSNNFYYNAVSLLTEENLSTLLNIYAQSYNNIDDPNKKSQINALIHDILNVMSVSEDKSSLCIPFILDHSRNMEFPDAADMLSSSSRSPEQFCKLAGQLSDETEVQLEYIASCILKKVISPEILGSDNINTMVGALIARSDYDTLARLAKLHPEIEESIRINFPQILESATEYGLPPALQITNILSHATNLTVPLILDMLDIDFNTLITNTPLQYLQIQEYFNICFDYAKENTDDLSAMISVYYQYNQMQWIEILLSETFNLIPNIDAFMDFFHSLLSDSNMPLEVMNHCFQIIINQNNFTELLKDRNLLASMIDYFPELLARWMLKQSDDTRYRWTDDNNDLMIMFYEKMLEADAVLAAALFYQHLLCLSRDNAQKIFVNILNNNKNCIIQLLQSMDRSMAVDILQRIEIQNPLQMLAALGFDVQDLV